MWSGLGVHGTCFSHCLLLGGSATRAIAPPTGSTGGFQKLPQTLSSAGIDLLLSIASSMHGQCLGRSVTGPIPQSSRCAFARQALRLESLSAFWFRLGGPVSPQISSIGPFRIHLLPSASAMRCLFFAVFQMPAMLIAYIELLGPAWELLSQGPSGFRPTCCTLGMPWR